MSRGHVRGGYSFFGGGATHVPYEVNNLLA